MGLQNVPITYWTDSANALYWIKRTENWATFVYNRVQEIRNLSDPNNWKHIPGHLNPADLPSRGCNSDELFRTRWWEGPRWLKSSPNEWPMSKIDPDLEVVNREKKKTIVSATNTESEVFEYTNRISSYHRIIRIMAWIKRFCFNCRNRNNRRTNKLTVEEMSLAEKIILKNVQQQDLEKEKRLNLATFTADDGLIKVKTRIAMRKDLETFRYPILLPSKHPIVKKLIHEKHVEHCHCGLQTLISILRENFWIIKCRKTVRQVIRECVKCKRFDDRPMEITSPPLPEDRVRDALVFEVTGTDLCGPLHLKNGSKCWIVLFTCAVYRAIHLELVSSLSTESFVLALRRFISRRGRPSTIYSDNGSNLVGTVNELKTVDWQAIQENASLKKISWKLNPPSAPWWGGFWERLIGMIKRILRKIIGNASLTYEELYTILCDTESIINSRPLTYISEDTEDLVALTPAMFLQEIKETGLPDLDQIDSKKLKKRIIYKHKLMQDLRQRFRSEYLGQLKEFHRKFKDSVIEIGDIVLVGDTNSKRINWPLAKVVNIFPSKDGRIRLVQVKTQSGTFLRPIQRLYHLEVSERLHTPMSPPAASSSPPAIESRQVVDQLISIPETFLSPDVSTANVDPSQLRRSRYGRLLRPTNRLNL